MAETKQNIQKENGQLSSDQMMVYQELSRRLHLANRMGMTHGGDRDLYGEFGYPVRVGLAESLEKFRRHDIGKAIINRPVKATWKGPLTLLESDDDEQTPLEKAWDELTEEHQLKDKFLRADRLTALGRYGVLLLGLDDVKNANDMMMPADGKRKLLYVKPLKEDSAQITQWDTRSGSERFGQPVMYEITIANPMDGSKTITRKVHYTRVIHITQDRMESEVYGTPVLEAVFNRLVDLEKLVGGSAEMYWRGARPGFAGEVDKEFDMPPNLEDDMKKQVAEYEHGLRRFFIQQGVKLHPLMPQVSDPSSHVDVQIQMISAITGIPKRILVGSERGELASSQDQEVWKEMITDRREEFASPGIIRPFVQRCIELGILPEPTDSYDIEWSDLYALSDKDKAEVGLTRARALKEYASEPMAETIMPQQVFLEFFLGLDKNKIELIQEMIKASVREEEDDLRPIPGEPGPGEDEDEDEDDEI